MAVDIRLYDRLNLSSEATTAEIKKAYRLLALKYHPDKNNHSEEAKAKFLEVCEAYEILSDDRKRKLYDQYGTVDECAIQQQQQGPNVSPSFFGSASSMGMSAGDLFAQFFDNVASTSMPGFGTRRNNMPSWPSNAQTGQTTIRRGPDIKHCLNCTLSEIYHGKSTKLGLNRRRICKTCRGHGGLKKRTCKRCQGRGQITETRRMGPMMQTWTQTCSDCNGSGFFLKNSDLCKECQGEGCIKERKIFDVEVKPGMNHGQTILLPGEADEIISTSYGNEKVQPGDVIITITQTKDKNFQRCNTNGCDLVMKNCKIPLSTSLCGGEIYIDGHPNNKLLKVSIIPGEIIKPNCFKSIENLGMPKYIKQNDGSDGSITEGYGNLYIQFKVEFPETLEAETVQKLKEVLQNDKNVKKQITAQDNTVYERLDDCVEMEDHVLSDFVPKFNDMKTMYNKRKDFEDKRGSKRRKYQFPTSQQDGMDMDTDFSDIDDMADDEPQNCTIH